jgi:hypothetical protein
MAFLKYQLHSEESQKKEGFKFIFKFFSVAVKN